jgi:LEA14-like dessication related protein
MTVSARRTVGVLAVLVGSLVLLASCTSMEPPKLILEAVDCRGLSTEGLEFDLNVIVENPNGFAVEAAGLKYRALVDGVSVAHGLLPDAVDIPADGSVDVSIPLTLEWSGASRALEELKAGGSHEWRLEGRATLRKGMYRRTFTFAEVGSFSTGGQGGDEDRASEGL